MLTRADFAVVVLAVVAVGISAWVAWAPRAPGAWVEVRGPGLALQLPLHEDAVHEIAGRVGVSVIEVSAGQARFAAAPCSNRVCIAAGWLRRAGDFAACAPNGVSLRLADGPVYDGIAY